MRSSGFVHCRQEIIIADAKEEFYQMFCELKTEIEENWL